MKRPDPSPARSSSGLAPAAPEPTPVGRYFSEIADLRVLTRSEEQGVARRFQERRGEVQALLAGLPLAARALLARWREGQRRGGSAAGQIGSRCEDDAAVLAGLRRVERRLRRWPREGPATAGGPVARAEALLRADLLALELHPDFYTELERDLQRRDQELAGVAGSERRRLQRRNRTELGLSAQRLRRITAELDRLCAGRDVARNELARHNLKLVVRMAKEFRNLGVSFADLIQEANLGLLRAIDLFDPERGLKFSTYAVWWIRQALVRAVQKQARTVRLPSHVNDRLYRLTRASERLTTRSGRAPTFGELGRELGIPAAQVEHLSGVGLPALSLDGSPGPFDERPLRERIADPRPANPQDRIEREQVGEEMGSWLEQLDEPERAIIRGRFGFSGEEKATLHALSETLGVSRERVRQLEKRALSKLRRLAEEGRALA
jgi:RNA polymerase sigma factor (sigma-70 family)